MAKAKLTALAGTVTVMAMGTETLSGVVTLIDGGVTVTYKKPRSSKFLTETFPTSSVAVAMEGEEGYVTRLGLVEIASVDVEDIHTSVVYDDGQVTITDAEGDVTLVMLMPGVEVSVQSEPQDAAGAEPKAKGKAAPAAKGKAKAKPEEEPAEDEDDKPKGKKGGKKAKTEEEPAEEPKGKKGGKKDKKGDDGW